jgi:hypothetical protein
MATPFLVLFFKRVYHHTDSAVVFFAVAGSLGAAAMALFSGFSIDRIGPKPLLFIFAAILIGTLLLTVLQPGIDSAVLIFIVPAIIYFFFQMGLFGLMTAGDTYFFASIAPEHRLDIGIVYSLAKGVGGITGGLLGGVYHSVLVGLFNGNQAGAFQIFFATVAVMVGTILFLATRLPDTGPFSIQDTIGILFSPRDLRAIRLLNRLDRSKTHREERKAVEALRASTSSIPVGDLLSRMDSPSLFVRTEALQAVRSGHIDSRARDKLLQEAEQHEYTTAHLAAETIGEREISEGVPVLRQALQSRDYLLVSKSMVALARLEDRASLPRIIEIVRESQNPRVIIFGAKALEFFQDPTALSVLFDRLASASFPFVREDLLVSIAGLCGMSEWFYPLYSVFLQEPGEALVQLEEYNRRIPDQHIPLPSREKSASDPGFTAALRQALERERIVVGEDDITDAITTAVRNPALIRLSGFRFCVTALLIFDRLHRLESGS